jgi:hypothetical protein
VDEIASPHPGEHSELDVLDTSDIDTVSLPLSTPSLIVVLLIVDARRSSM